MIVTASGVLMGCAAMVLTFTGTWHSALDLGIINTAIVGPATVAGALSAALVSLGGHPTLFAATALVAAAGSVLVWRIKSVP